MRVISRATLKAFYGRHADAKGPLEAWFAEAKRAVWREFNDIKNRYRSADAVGENRVVFNIKGNAYRLVVVVHYRVQTVYVRFVGTHAEYDRVDVETV